MCRLVIDLQAQAAYIESDGNGIQIDFIGHDEWTTKPLSDLINIDAVAGIEILDLHAIDVFDEYGIKQTYKLLWRKE